MDIRRIGIWTSALDRQRAPVVRRAAREIERLGYGALWVGEASRREAFAHASLLLSATDRLVVATGIANIWARDPLAMVAGQRTLAEAWGGRFLLGLGVSHDRWSSPGAIATSDRSPPCATIWTPWTRRRTGRRCPSRQP